MANVGVDRGLVMPNYQWHGWRQEELEAVVELRPEVLEVLVYDVATSASAEKLGQLDDLLWRCRAIRRVQLRPYSTRIPKIGPREWARECLRRAEPYAEMLGHADPEVELELIPANEVNLPGEGGHSDWSRHLSWLEEFGAEFGVGSMWRIGLHVPAVSPGVIGYFGYYQRLGRARAGLSAYRYVDVHCYGGARDFEEVHELFPGWDVSITEFNGVDPGEYLASLPGYVSDASWFILSGEDDQRPYFLMGAPAYESFRRSARNLASALAVSGGDSPGRVVDGPGAAAAGYNAGGARVDDDYQAWLDQGGAADAYRAHRLAIGGEELTTEGVTFLKSRINTAVEELTKAIDIKFPFS